IKALPRKQTNNLPQLEPVAKHRVTELENAASLKLALPPTVRDTIIDKLLQSVSSALVLLHTVTEGSLSGEIRRAVLTKGTTAADPQVADLFERFLPEEQRVKTLGTDINPGAILALK